MFENTYILLLVFFSCVGLFLLRCLYKLLFREEVIISALDENKISQVIGILEYSNNNDDEQDENDEITVVNIVGASFDTPYIGRVSLDSQKRAVVHVIDSDLELEAENPYYKLCGYVDKQGFIYELENGHYKKIGYMARPSNPSVPTIVGERHWYSFWKKRLNVYLGTPSSAKEVGRCKRTGFHIGSRDPYPSEARACGYAMFFSKKRSCNNYSDYYKNPSTLWRDTALLAAVVYSIIYFILFIINSLVIKIPLFGRNIYGMLIVSCFYYVIWAVVRDLKIKKAELSNSIKPQLDLLNKNVGLRLTDRMITILGCLVIVLCYILYEYETAMAEVPYMGDIARSLSNFTHYDFDFLPLVFAIVQGVTINRMQRAVPRPWKIKTGMEREGGDAGDDVVLNPKGKIDITYDWLLDSFNGIDLHGQVTLHFNKEEYIDPLRLENPFHPQIIERPTEKIVNDMFFYIQSNVKAGEHVKYLANYINEVAERKHLDNIDRLQFALDFVQEPNILYRSVHGSKSLDFAINYMRFPDETLYDKEGDYNCKAFLATVLLYEMGSDVLFMYSEKYSTAAVGVEISDDELERYFNANTFEDVLCEINGKKYLFCDVVCDIFRIGFIEDGKSIRDYDMKVEFLHSYRETGDNDVKISTDENLDELPPSVSKDERFRWDLDSYFGTKLVGDIKLHFEAEYMDTLRKNNPYNGSVILNSNEEGVKDICRYMRRNPESTANLKMLADYIRHTVSVNFLNEVDARQFILDFVQEPNIKYKVDNESLSIGRKKQYVRFPDETLYDREGDCDCKTMLAAFLFKECGYETLILLSATYKHAALAVECNSALAQLLESVNVSGVTLEHEGKTYIFCESTGDGFKIGQMANNETIDCFDQRIVV